MDFCTKPPNFGVEAHMEAPAGDALIALFRLLGILFVTLSTTLDTSKNMFGILNVDEIKN
jgi:hypothetical protein